MIDPECSGSIEPLLEMLEGKWTLQLLRELFNGVKRFGELRRSLHPISPKTLTDRLRLLEERRIVTRTIYSEVPLHVEYELTERGQRLQPIFAAMWAWTQSEDADSKKRRAIRYYSSSSKEVGSFPSQTAINLNNPIELHRVVMERPRRSTSICKGFSCISRQGTSSDTAASNQGVTVF